MQGQTCKHGHTMAVYRSDGKNHVVNAHWGLVHARRASLQTPSNLRLETRGKLP